METLQRTANRGSISTGYDIDNSAAFGGANGIQFNPSSDGNRRTWTVSLWLKRSELSTETTIFGSQNTVMVLMDPDWFRFSLYTGSATYYFDTENGGPVYRDTSAWYNFVFQCDTTQGTAADRAKLWVNGESVTNTNSNTIPQNAEFDLNDNTKNIQVGYFYAGNEQLDGYLSEIHFTDGVANDADAFGEYDGDSGIWKPKAYAGSYGTNGFYLEFKESAASATGIGKDTSGNGHNFSTGGTYPSQATDTPTNNFCTWNPLQNYDGKHLYRDGATTFDLNTNSGSGNSALGSMAFTKGKWYAEFKPKDATTSYPYNVFIGAGVMDQVQLLSTGFLGGKANSTAQGAGYYNANGKIYRSGANVAWGDTYVGDDIISVAFDYRSDGTAHMYVAKNGTWQNSSDPANDTNPITLNGGSAFDDNTFIALGASIYVHDVLTIECNFGGYTAGTISSAASDANGYGTFEYAPPSGYYALCSKNLAEYG